MKKHTVINTSTRHSFIKRLEGSKHKLENIDGKNNEHTGMFS